MYMSSGTRESKDIFLACKQNVSKFFTEIEKSTPSYHQSVAKLQQEYVEGWQKVINSSIELEREYANKAGLNTAVPEAALKTIRDMTEEAIKAYAAQNKIAVETADPTKQAFEVFNGNTKQFASLNRNIMESMMAVVTQAQKT